MKKLICLFSVVMLVTGCTAFNPNYYTDPNSPGYTEKALGGLCEKCNRVFYFSGQLLNTAENVQCCYCGQTQNLKMASNRYAYLKQQQDAQESAKFTQALYNFNQSLQKAREESAERRQKAYEEYQQSLRDFNKPGTAWNPMHVKVDN